MKKKLVIRFVKFEYALAMQVLEMEGEFSDSEHVKIGDTRFCYDSCTIAPHFYIAKNNLVGVGYFGKNEQRDEYLNNVVKWISEEQFATGGKLEIGKPCMVSLFEGLEKEDWEISRLLAILPRPIENRYITQSEASKRMFAAWPCARPLAFVRPKIDGDIYTWEMEVAE